MAVAMPTHRFTVDEFERMIEAGVLAEDARVELIRGEIVEMSPIGGRHIACVARSTSLLARQTGPDVWVSVQSAIRLPEDGEPQPDIVLLRSTYRAPTPPSPVDIVLVIEVADSSLHHDRNAKLPLYAEAGIPEAWIFDLLHDQIERHTEPHEGRYRQVAVAGRGQALSSAVAPTVTFEVDEALGPRESGAV